ncbi:MAG: hypothetical protein Q8Q33_11010, partial [Chlamydiota bacterium]|nr:hypothetical protein [Chlamydiota bacterium]
MRHTHYGKNTPSRYHWGIRIVSLVTLFCFFIGDFGMAKGIDYAQPTPPPALQEESQGAPSQKMNLETFQIPRDIGDVKSSFRGSSDKIVVHIQDAHCNYEAQTNSAKIIHDMLKKDKGHDFNLIALEGADGLVDTSFLTAFPDEKVRQQVARYLLKRGKITGPEYLSIIGDKPLMLKGIETLNLYFDNLLAFDESVPLRNEAEPLLEDLSSYIHALELKIYPKDFQDFLALERSYQKHDLEFNAFAKALSQEAQKVGVGTADYKNFKVMLSVQVLESQIQIEKVEEERLEVINILGQRLVKEDISELLAKSLYYRLEKIPAEEYFNYLVKLADRGAGLDLKHYPNLSAYIRMVNIFASIDKDRLFDECEQLSKKVQEKYLQNDDQRYLFAIAHDLVLLENFYRLELTRTDLAYYYENENDLSVAKMVHTLKSLGQKYAFAFSSQASFAYLDENLGPLKRFYH